MFLEVGAAKGSSFLQEGSGEDSFNLHFLLHGLGGQWFLFTQQDGQSGGLCGLQSYTFSKALSGMKRVLLSCGFLCAVCPTAVFTVIARSWVRSKCEKTLRYFKHSMVKRNARTPVRVKSIARSARGMGEGKHCWQTFKHSCPDRTARKKNLVTAFAAYADGKEVCRLKFGC